MLSRLLGHLGKYLALTGARLNGKELVAAVLVTYFVPFEKLPELEKCLVSLNNGAEAAVKSIIEEFSTKVSVDEESVLNKRAIIDYCFSKDSVEEITKALEVEASKEENSWINPVLKGLKRSSPMGLKITLRLIREGRKQSLPECLKKEFHLITNILWTVISGDVYEGIGALNIDKDNCPKWEPATLEEVNNEKLNLLFQPFEEELKHKIPEKEDCRWEAAACIDMLKGFHFPALKIITQ